MMLRMAWVCIVLCIGLCLGSSAAAKVVDRVVAVVNDEVITWSELEDTARPILARVAAIRDPVERVKARDAQLAEALDSMVAKRLVAQEAARRNIGVPASEVSGHLKRIQGRQGWTEEQLRFYLSGQGLSIAEFRAEVREQLLQQKIVGTVLGAKIRISDRDLEDFHKEKTTRERADYEVDAAHIVLTVREGASAGEDTAVRHQMGELLKRAQSGEDFATLARQYSQGPGAQNGGHLGTLRRGSLNAELERAIFSLEPGAVDGPIRTGFGYHIVKVLGRKRAPPEAFEAIKDRLRAELQERKLAAELSRWVDQLKQASFVEIRL